MDGEGRVLAPLVGVADVGMEEEEEGGAAAAAAA